MALGFGPKAPDVDSGVQAVKDLIALLYPDRATDRVLDLFASSARALLTAKAALSFENIARLWRDPDWRAWIMDRWDKPLEGPWTEREGEVVEPDSLDPDFGWLIADRLSASAPLQDPDDD